jgi:REP element-mobilizing transposase RayT
VKLELPAMDKYNPKIHHRKSIRLNDYDYSQVGFYFVTICCQHRACLFGGIVDDEMILNDAGKMVANEWLKLKIRFKNIELQEYVVMPNHFHGIVEIVGATLVVAQNNATTYNVMGNIRKGQPQGIAPTDKTIAHTDKTIAHSDKTVAHMDKTVAHTDKTVAHTDKTVAHTDKTIPHTDKTIGDMVGAFESITTVEYIRCVKNNHWQPFDGKLWQRNFWEHIIRNENEYRRITQYILDNPKKWAMDKLNGGDGNQVMESPVGYNAEAWMT